jgi:very-short-patch-repair endonuclease
MGKKSTQRLTLKDIEKSTAKIVWMADISPAQKLFRKRTKKNTGLSIARTPQHILWDAIQEKWPGQAAWEYEGAVPGRNFRIDIAFPPPLKIAVEMDGWEWHGKYLKDFKRDRERQNLLCFHGWRVLRFTASQIHSSLHEQIEIIGKALYSYGSPY